MEHLGLDHPYNRILLGFLETWDPDERIPDLKVARRLAGVYQTVPELGPLEVVEITSHGERPQAGGSLLGYDVPFKDGMESLLASILLYSDPFGEHSPNDDSRITDLRRRFADRLNENLLFATEEDATEFFVAAEEVGPWEGPEIEWEVVGLWLVEDGGTS